MKTCILFILLCLFSISITAQHLDFKSVPPDTYTNLENRFKSYQVVEGDIQHLTELSQVQFRIDNRVVWTIDLKHSDLLSAHYTSNGQRDMARAIPYHGILTSRPHSIVSLTLGKDFMYGFIDSGDKRMLIEPLRYFINDAPYDQFIIYDRKDYKAQDTPVCGTDERHHKHEELLHKMQQQAQAGAPGDCWIIELAIASDYQMYQKYNNSIPEVEDHNIGVMNDVATDYKGPFEDTITFKIVEQYVVNCSGCDPWTSSTDAGTLLGSFRDWGEAGGFNCDYDLAQLWTARDFNGGTVGIAYLGAVCTTVKYHALQDINNAEQRRVLGSHEIGHNFNASHAPSGGFIMSAFLNITTTWHQNSKNAINNYVNQLENQGCMDPCVYDPPGVNFSASHPTICVGSQTYFDDLSSGEPTEWDWSFPGGSPSNSFEENPVVSYAAAGTYDVTLTATNEHGSSTTTLFGYISVVDGGEGESVIFNDDFEFGLGNWTIDNPDNGRTWEDVPSHASTRGETSARVNFFDYSGSGQRDALISNTFDLTDRVGTKCTFDYAYARTSFSSDDELNVYASRNGGATFPDLVYSNSGSNTAFRTSGDKGTGVFNPCSEQDWCESDCIEIDLAAYDAEPNFALKIEAVHDGGNAIYIDNFYLVSACEVLDPPVAQFSSNTNTGCISFDVQFFDDSEGVVSDRLWTFEGGVPATSTDPNPIVTYNNPGFWDVSLEVSNTAGTSFSSQPEMIWARAVPEVDFTYDINGLTVFFTNLSLDGDSFFWDFGDGQISEEEHPTHTYASGGFYTVTLSVTNVCGTSSSSKEIELTSAPSAAFSANPQTGYPTLEVQYFDDSEGEVVSRLWTFSGGNPESSTLQNPVVLYNTSGTYSSTLIVTNSVGSDTLTRENFITVDAVTEADFAFATMFSTVDFNNQSTNWDALDWNFGDGNTSTEENPSHTYTADGTYQVRLISTNTCGPDTTYQDVTISTSNMLSFQADNTQGCVPFEVQFNNNSSAQYTSYAWTFEGGTPPTSTEANPVITYNTRGQFDVTLIGTAPTRVDTLVQNDYIQADDIPQSSFTTSQNGLTYSFTNTSMYATGYQWDFGDGMMSTEANPMHTYTMEGDYTVTLTATNTCGDANSTAVLLVTANPLIVDMEPKATNACKDDVVHFVDMSSGDPDSRIWTFEGGTPASSTEAEVDVRYSMTGTYQVKLEITRGTESVSQIYENAVTILKEPIANFSFEDQGDGFVQFTNLSTFSESYLWDFGDGNTSMEFSPAHQYTNDGDYTVTLKSTGICGEDQNALVIELVVANKNLYLLDGIRLYPNPTTDDVHVEWLSPTTGTLSIEIYNLLGQRIKMSTEKIRQTDSYRKDVDLKGLSSGTYLIKLVQGESAWFSKLVVIH